MEGGAQFNLLSFVPLAPLKGGPRGLPSMHEAGRANNHTSFRSLCHLHLTMTITTSPLSTAITIIPTSPATATIGAGTTITRINIPSHARRLWFSRIASGLRTALACFIVGCATIYAPPQLRLQLKFPAFAYVTAVLIAGEATVGDSLQGAAHALLGTIMAMPPAVISMLAIGNWQYSVVAATMAVTLTSFAVMLPQSTPLITKRIALGQTVLVYVEAFKLGRGATAIEHPIHVAASTMVGVVAAVLAVLLPIPRLACHEVRKKNSYFREIEMARLRLYTTTFCAEDRSWALAAISQAYSLSKEAVKLLCSIQAKQGSTKWERPPIKSQQRFQSDMLHAIDLPLRGMEIALSSAPFSPPEALTQELRDYLNAMEDRINLALMEQDNRIIKKQVKYEQTNLPCLWNTVPLTSQNIPTIFFIFCMRLLLKEAMMTQFPKPIQKMKSASVATMEPPENSLNQDVCAMKKNTRACDVCWISREMLMIAFKSSLSMGLAVLFGVLYSKDNGYWSGLTVAMAITPWREATFKLANLRAQGTALGTVYGVLGSFISQSLMELRFMAILPWIFFTSFLRQSRMFGQAGGIAAAVSAIIMIGRKNYGSPPYFAIARLCETLIGLLCSILVEITLQPTRASSLARSKLCHTIESLQECLDMAISAASAHSPHAYLTELKAKKKKLVQQIHELKKHIREAEGEPNFWFLPFAAATYIKMHGLLSKMTELITFLCHSIESIAQTPWEEIQESIRIEVEPLKTVSASIQCLKEVLQIKSLVKLEKELMRKTIPDDPEMAKERTSDRDEVVGSSDDEESDMIQSCFLRNAQSLMERSDEVDGDMDSRNRLALSLGAFAFCTKSLSKETIGLENGILELLQGENPSKYINLYEISCKAKQVLPL